MTSFSILDNIEKIQEKFKLSFENIMENEAFAPKEQMLHFPWYFQIRDTVKPVLSGDSKKTKKLVFKTDHYCLIQVKSFADCCNTFDIFKLPFTVKTFVLSILSGRLRQVLLYFKGVKRRYHGVKVFQSSPILGLRKGRNENLMNVQMVTQMCSAIPLFVKGHKNSTWNMQA